MSYRTLANGATLAGRYGDGGDSSRPDAGKWVWLYNSSGYTMFIPENTAAERDSVYNNFPYRDVNYSDFLYTIAGQNRYVRLNTAIGTGPCWSPYFGGTYGTTASCPAGYTDLTGQANAEGNPLDYSGAAGIPTNTVWDFYWDNDYGCPSGYVAGVSSRRCYKVPDAIGYQ